MKEDMSLSNLGTVAFHAAKVPTIVFSSTLICLLTLDYQESIQLSTTPDPGYQWESDNVTIRHHKREPKGQPFPSR